MQIKPQTVRVDASTICQLRCPSCPTTAGDIDKFVGSGFLKFEDFKSLIEKNPYIQFVELTNWGEIFLNPEILKIIEYSHEKGIKLLAKNGVNLNNVKPEVLEALVKYQFRNITVSIDGATPETYAIYRVRGNLETVLANIRKINEYKKQYNSEYPQLAWQFIIFGHNEHEIEQAKALAAELNMLFIPKLNWEDLYDKPFSPITDKEAVRAECGAADRTEFRERNNRNFCSVVCQELWTSPQINFDGEVLGCPVNHWSSFGNAFKDDLLEIVNSERMNYARAMVLGQAEERVDIACTDCKIYKEMKEHKTWIRLSQPDPDEQVRQQIMQARGFTSL